MSKRILLAAFAAALAFAPAAFAHEVKIGPLTLTDLWTRATPPNAPSGGGYLTITNSGDGADRLIAVSTPEAGKSEIHEMKVNDGVMTMRPVEGGVEIPAGGSVALAPGGFHLMFMALKAPFVAGEKLPVTLTFEKAGTIDTFLHVEPIGSKGPGKTADHGTMDHGTTEAPAQ